MSLPQTQIFNIFWNFKLIIFIQTEIMVKGLGHQDTSVFRNLSSCQILNSLVRQHNMQTPNNLKFIWNLFLKFRWDYHKKFFWVNSLWQRPLLSCIFSEMNFLFLLCVFIQTVSVIQGIRSDQALLHFIK